MHMFMIYVHSVSSLITRTRDFEIHPAVGTVERVTLTYRRREKNFLISYFLPCRRNSLELRGPRTSGVNRLSLELRASQIEH